MNVVDTVIENLTTLTDSKRAIWAANAARTVARGPRRNPSYADALRLRDAIATFEAIRPASIDLIHASGLDWDRTIKGRTRFRGFDGDRLVAHITRVAPSKFAVEINGALLPGTYTTLSTARAVAAEAPRNDGATHAA